MVTDHESLKWLATATSGKVQRWALYLQQYDFTVLHLNGEHNQVADWLSRAVDVDEDHLLDQMSVSVAFIEDNARQHFPSNEELSFKDISDVPEEDRQYVARGKSGVCYNIRSGKVYIPPQFRDNVLYWFHAGAYGGHNGVNRTLRRMKQYVWWPSLHKRVAEYIAACLLCQRNLKRPQFRALRYVLEKPSPFQVVSLDHVQIGPNEGLTAPVNILVVIDHYSRFVQSYIVPDLLSKSTVLAFRNHWVTLFGAPDCVLTDRGPSFRANEFNEYVTINLGSYHSYSSAYYPQGNGLNESSHQIIKSMIKAGLKFKDLQRQHPSEKLEQILTLVMMVYNSTPTVLLAPRMSYCLAMTWSYLPSKASE